MDARTPYYICDTVIINKLDKYKLSSTDRIIPLYIFFKNRDNVLSGYYNTHIQQCMVYHSSKYIRILSLVPSL